MTTVLWRRYAIAILSSSLSCFRPHRSQTCLWLLVLPVFMVETDFLYV